MSSPRPLMGPGPGWKPPLHWSCSILRLSNQNELNYKQHFCNESRAGWSPDYFPLYRLGWSSLVWPEVNLVSRQFSMHGGGKIIVWSMAYSYIIAGIPVGLLYRSGGYIAFFNWLQAWQCSFPCDIINCCAIQNKSVICHWPDNFSHPHAKKKIVWEWDWGCLGMRVLKEGGEQSAAMKAGMAWWKCKCGYHNNTVFSVGGSKAQPI